MGRDEGGEQRGGRHDTAAMPKERVSRGGDPPWPRQAWYHHVTMTAEYTRNAQCTRSPPPSLVTAAGPFRFAMAGPFQAVGLAASRVSIAAAIVTWMFGVGASGTSAAAEYPRRPIKVVVPFAAGGGSDMFGRVIQHAIDDGERLPHPIVIVNVPGAGGTIGSRRVKNARPDGYTLLLLHEGILTAKHAGQAAYGPEAFEPIAGTGNVDQVVAVREDSPHRDLPTLMAAASERPDQIVCAANLGAPSHFAGLMLEACEPGARFRYMQSGGGAKRFAAVQGGHADVSAFSIAEYSQFRDAGLRALAVFGRRRHEDFPELPTASELGYDVVSENMHFWWAPRGTPAGRIEVVAEALRRAMGRPDVRRRLATLRTEPVFLGGDLLTDEIAERDRRLGAVSDRPVRSLPNLPLITLAVTAVLGVWAWRSTRGAAVQVNRWQADSASHRRIAVAVLGATCLYVAVMQAGWVGFRGATVPFVFVVGGMLAPDRRVLPWLACLAIGLGIGIHTLFTSVLVVDLP